LFFQNRELFGFKKRWFRFNLKKIGGGGGGGGGG